MRSIEAEATAAARRGAQRDQRAAQQRATTAQAAARRASRSEAAIERERQRHAARMRAHEHRLRMADLRERERSIRRETEALKQQNREIDRQIRASRRRSMEMERSARAAQVARERTAGRIMAGAGRVARGTAGVIGGGIRTAGGLVAIGGTLAVGNAVRTQMDELALASSLANQAGSPEVKGELLRESQSIEGFSGTEVLGAIEQFASLTGDLESARKLMSELGRFALATGTRLEDAAAAAGNFANNLDGIDDPGRRAAAIMEAMRALGGQGMAGAVEIKDLAGGGATLGAVASQMAGDPLENIKKAGVLAQAARSKGGAASPAEALTAVARFTDQLAANADKLERLGVRVGTRDSAGNLTELADPRQVVADILEKTGGDIGQINSLLGIYGQKVVRGFAGSFRERGRQGVFDQFDSLMLTELAADQIDTRAASRLEDPDLQFKEVVKDFNRELGEKLLPELTKLIPELAKLTPHVVELTTAVIKAAEFFGENPFAGLGLLVGGLIVKEIAVAGIGAAVSSAITKAIAGGAAGTAAGAAAGAAGEVAAGAAGGAAARRGFLGKLASGGKAAVAGAAATGAAMLALVGTAVGNALLHQRQIAEEEERDPGTITSTRLGTSMWAGPAMAGVPMDVPTRPSQQPGNEGGQEIKEGAEALKLASAEIVDAARELKNSSVSTAAQRTSPMSKRP